MGRSKFPGKPSKLVTKKRVSVLNGIINNPFCDNFNDDDADDIPNDQISLTSSESSSETTTIGGHDGDSQKTTSQKPIPPDPPDQDDDEDGEDEVVPENDEDDDTTQESDTKVTSKVSTRARKPISKSPEPSASTPSTTTTPATTTVSSEKPAKKKSVTFKNVLETSDDVNIVKKVYNPNKVPSVPIIKVNKNRQDLSRSERFARGDIVMPSRLTEVLKNYTANHIDKLNLLTFKSAAFKTNDSDTNKSVNFDFKINNNATSSSSSSEKRFVLPKRSVHSCRVIKPNKKFLDDSVTSSASGFAGSTSTTTATATKFCRKSNFLKKLNPRIADTGIVSDRDRDYRPMNHKTDNFINNTLSSQIGSSNLDECDQNESETSQTATDDDEDDEDNVASDDNDDKMMEEEAERDNNVKNAQSSVSFANNPFSANNLNPFSRVPMTSSKFILRQPMLQFSSTLTSTTSKCTDGPFSLNLNKMNQNVLPTNSSILSSPSASLSSSSSTNNSICGVCSTILSTNKPIQQSRKFGITSCAACRKFMSDIKKLILNGNGTANALQCNKNDGSCSILPIHKSNHAKSIHNAFKDRCHACWLKMCIKSFQVPSRLRTKMLSILPDNSVNTVNNISIGSSTNIIMSPFTVKMEKNDSSTANIFSACAAANSTNRLLNWSLDASAGGDCDLKPTPGKIMSLSNPLVENNSTFGTSPLQKPTIAEKPVIMVSSSIACTNATTPSVTPITNTIATSKVDTDKETIVTNTVINSKPIKEVEDTTRLRLRKKDKDVSVPNSVTVTTTTSSMTSGNNITTTVISTPVTTSASSSTTSAETTTQATAKRQRIDLKGPRVKHVCRSASIVLGQPIATFPNGEEDETVTQTIVTESETDIVVLVPLKEQQNEITLPTVEETTVSAKKEEIPEVLAEKSLPPPPKTDPLCQDCNEQSLSSSSSSSSSSSTSTIPVIENTENDSQLVEKMEADDDMKNKENIEIRIEPMDEVEDTMSADITDTDTMTQDASSQDTTSINVKKLDEPLKPMTRKLARPPLLSKSMLGPTNKKLNAFSRQQQKPAAIVPPLISIDFWENYDPAEVCQTGFGLIVSETVPLRALCFLCGSSGQDELIFCVCCCEPYHRYCVEDEYNLKQSSLDDTNVSIGDSMILGGGNNTTMNMAAMLTNRLNWLCPRCTVCYTCNTASGSKVKCQKCQKNYHSTCLGTSKRLSGADRPLICANCLKCKSCSTTNVSKFVGNLPMCSGCFRLRQKGNYCPLCQKCYEDNDYNIKMMECGDCKRWVHAKCEGLTDEQYNMLSVLPENIEFICKKCAKINAAADTWRDAVVAEFKSGLLSVVRLLSKSRQACALLKLSPRKKSGACVCQPVQSNRTILFDAGKDDYLTTLDDGSSSQDMDDMFLPSTDNITSTTIAAASTKCYCGANEKSTQNASQLSLLDIKQKINANEYFSLGDFNYDMNIIITAAACDDLMIAYKEILSETFPWFQNETKACTDALEEDMYDSCDFAGMSSASMMNDCGGNGSDNGCGTNGDQQVPMLDIPEDIDDYFYSTYNITDTRACMFCKGIGDGVSDLHESRLLYCGQNSWVHTNCAMWSAEVFEEIDGSLQNVHSAISRGRLIKCSKCGTKGATVGCNVRTCGEHYHYICARNANCAFMIDKTVYCPQHLSDASRKKCAMEKNFEVLRPVYVELDRKKKKFIDPAKVQFVIGSLQVKQLGKYVSTLSDTEDAIIPADFMCTRLYWSSKEPWKIVEYTVRTSIENNLMNQCTDLGRNFTVDHSNNSSLVQFGLAQISKWHSSLLSGEDFEFVILQERSVKQLLDAVNAANSADETNEDEPQNNADLLPPEIKDAIFEDLPHDILDGISMLDIFPKLMTYEDLVAMDNKSEYMNNDMMRDSRDYNMSDDDLSDDQKDYDAVENNWISNNMPMNHVEDALLSAVRPIGGVGCSSGNSSRELKRSKSEIFSRGVAAAAAARGQQRSSSLTWNCKVDSSATSVKRRKMSRFDLRLPDGVLLSLGRRKEDLLPPPSSSSTSSITERRRSLYGTEEIKNRNFTWSAAKKMTQIDELTATSASTTTTTITTSIHDSYVPKDMLDKLKISQLDGMDDVSSGSDGDSPIHEYPMATITTYDANIRESPVKCDRCHCTYRTYDSYNRHLMTCEPMSTSESESESTARSPDLQSPHQNMIITSLSGGGGGGGQEYCTLPITLQQSQQIQQQQQQIYNFNGQQINPITIQQQPIHLQQNTQQSTTMQNQCGIQNATTIPIQHHQVQGMILNPSHNNGQPQQQQLFAQPTLFPIQNLTSQTNIANQYANFDGNKSQHQRIQPTGQFTLPNGFNIQTSQPIAGQPQIITFSQANNNTCPQIMTITSQSTPSSTSNTRTIQQHHQSSPYKNQLILPQPADHKQIINQSTSSMNKRQGVQKMMQSSTTTTGYRTKNSNSNRQTTTTTTTNNNSNTSNKPIQIKRTIVKTTTNDTTTTKPIQIFNQTTMPIIRQQQTNDCSNNNVILQQSPSANGQSIIVQQLGGQQGNLVQYVTDSNGMQYITALPTATANEYKPQPTQYLTPNPLVPGTYQIQTADSGSILLANPAPTTGLQMLPNGTIQLTQQPQQPQVIGTIIQQQPTMCGMMSAEQMVLGGTPTLEMVTNPANGCMLLTNPPMYYGLETIVQNTVMSSQQFVSTAMQGVLSQNSSFSATTTQVFQASKIDPIMEMPTGYVVLNNDGTIIQAQPQPQNILSTANAVLQPNGIQQITQLPQLQHSQLQQIQLQQQQQQQQQQQSAQNNTWRLVDDKSTIQLLPAHIAQPQQQQQQQHQPMQVQQQHLPTPPPTPQPIQQIQFQQPTVQQTKPIVKSTPIVVTKVQPQNKIFNNANQLTPVATTSSTINQIILPKPQTATASYNNSNDLQHQQQQPQFIVQSNNKITGQSTKLPTSMPAIQPIQRKTNLIKPLVAAGTKMTSVKPKLMTKPVMTTKVQSIKQQQQQSAKQVLTIQQTSMPSATVPTQSISVAKQIVPLYQPQPTQQQYISSNNSEQNLSDINISVAAASTDVSSYNKQNDGDQKKNAVIIQDITIINDQGQFSSSFNTPPQQLSANNNFVQQKPIVSVEQCFSSNNDVFVQSKPLLQQQQQQHQQKPIQIQQKHQIQQQMPAQQQQQQQQQSSIQYNTTSSQPISLPMSNSIQLPTAPYAAPSYGNGIPTNVVNPIQQYNSSSNNNSNSNNTNNSNSNSNYVSRPTNRVLPMQTIQQHHKNTQPQMPPISPVTKFNSNTESQLQQQPHQQQLHQQTSQQIQQQQNQQQQQQQQSQQQHFNQLKKPITIDTSKLLPVHLDTLEPSPNQLIIVEKLNELPSLVDDNNDDDRHHHSTQQLLDQHVDTTSLLQQQDTNNDLSMEIDKIIDEKQSQLSSDGSVNDHDHNNDNDDDSSDNKDDHTTLTKMDYEQIVTNTDDVFDKLKGETNLNTNCELDNDIIDDDDDQTTTDEVKEQISEMLDNLENNQCNKDILEASLYNIVEADNNAAAAEAAINQNNNDLLTNHQIETVISDCTIDDLSQKDNLNEMKNSFDDKCAMIKELQQQPAAVAETKPIGPRMLYEIQSEDGFTYKSTSVSEIWEKVFETVQMARKAHGLAPLPEGPLADMCGHQMLGLKTNALKYLVEQLPGSDKCTKYTPKYHKKQTTTALTSSSSGYCSDYEELKENIYGAARCEMYKSRSEYDMFSWLASRHRKQPIQIVSPPSNDIELMPRRGTGSNLPMAMRYRTLKETYKETVGVYRSHIHGRGLFCNRDIEAGEMVIEYAGELIRSTLTDKREKYYDGRGIGCYMFKIDENLVVDATMRGNAARFINHACEPNCYSKVVDILGHKHIIIFALRRIVQGEELTYDYKFPFEETKIPCSCGSKKCRKYLN